MKFKILVKRINIVLNIFGNNLKYLQDTLDPCHDTLYLSSRIVLHALSAVTQISWCPDPARRKAITLMFCFALQHFIILSAYGIIVSKIKIVSLNKRIQDQLLKKTLKWFDRPGDPEAIIGGQCHCQQTGGWPMRHTFVRRAASRHY